MMKDSVQAGFIHWDSRRVPITEDDVHILMSAVSELLDGADSSATAFYSKSSCYGVGC